jgi:hypothetical protein
LATTRASRQCTFHGLQGTYLALPCSTNLTGRIGSEDLFPQRVHCMGRFLSEGEKHSEMLSPKLSSSIPTVAPHCWAQNIHLRQFRGTLMTGVIPRSLSRRGGEATILANKIALSGSKSICGTHRATNGRCSIYFCFGSLSDGRQESSLAQEISCYYGDSVSL